MRTTNVTGDTINNVNVIVAQSESTLTKVQHAFESRGVDCVNFIPEIKVKRAKDILYISQIRKTRMGNLLVTVEVYDTKKTDKAPMSIALLDDVAQQQKLQRLTSK